MAVACIAAALTTLRLTTSEVVLRAQPHEAFVGSVRVQALSPRLLRVEQKGPMGFEDRSSFMVVNRSAFTGVPVWEQSKGNGSTSLGTAYYEIEVSNTSPSFSVRSPSGELLYSSQSETEQRRQRHLLHWPSPLQQPAYALEDRPRFHVPPWGISPAPTASVVPELRGSNGYDFRNMVEGDVYVFLLGNTLPEWEASRQDFVALAGPSPVLPNFAHGTWFTYWHQYTEQEAKRDIDRWEAGRLPLDIWALDMNWRNVSCPVGATQCNHEQKGLNNGQKGSVDHYYDHPNTMLFPGDGVYGSSFTEWFSFLKQKRLRTYFNDHPFPVAARGEGGLQTSPEEVAFRWDGLTRWLDRGLTYWWLCVGFSFDRSAPFALFHLAASGLTCVCICLRGDFGL